MQRHAHTPAPGPAPMADSSRSGRSVLPQLNWGILDQALSSGTNFVLTLFVVRSVSPSDFGAFSVAFVVYVLAIGIARSFNAEPLVISHGGTAGQVQARAGQAMGGAVALGAPFGVGCLVAAAVVRGSLGGALLMLGCCLPLLLVQDTGRVLLFAVDRARGAAMNDGVWAIVQMIVLLCLLVRTSEPDLWQLMSAWLVSGSVAGLLALFQLRVRPHLGSFSSWLRSRRRLGVPLLGAYLLNIAPPYLLFALAPLVAGLGELGLARAAWVPFGPMGVVLQGTALVLLPAIAQRGVARTMHVVVRATVALVALAVAWSLIVLLMPDALGVALIGEDWTQTETIRVLFAGSLVAQAVSLSAVVAVGALEAPQRLVRVRAITAPVLIVGGLVLAARAQSLGIAIAILIGDSLTAVLAWRELRSAAARRLVAEARPDHAGSVEPDPSAAASGLATDQALA